MSQVTVNSYTICISLKQCIRRVRAERRAFMDRWCPPPWQVSQDSAIINDNSHGSETGIKSIIAAHCLLVKPGRPIPGHPRLIQCWPNVSDGGPTLKQPCVRVSYLMEAWSVLVEAKAAPWELLWLRAGTWLAGWWTARDSRWPLWQHSPIIPCAEGIHT